MPTERPAPPAPRVPSGMFAAGGSPPRSPAPRSSPVADGRATALSVYPGLQITDNRRDPNSSLGRANPASWHVRSAGAIDSRPIPGMSFDDYVEGYRRRGFDVIEARDEVNNPSGHATGPHWHVVLGGEPPPLPAGYRFAEDGEAAPAGPVPSMPSRPLIDPSSPPNWGGRAELIEDRAARTRAIAARIPPPQQPTITTSMMPAGNEANFNDGGAIADVPDPQQMASILGQLEAATDRGASEGELVSLAQRLNVLTPAMREQIAAHVRERDADPDRVRPFNAFVPATTRQAPARPREDLPTPGPDASPADVEAWNRERIARMNPEGTSLRPYQPRLTERAGDMLGNALEPVMGRYAATEAGNNAGDLLWWTALGAAEDLQSFDEAQRRAIIEGRPLDAAGNQIGAQVSAAGLIPIIGPGTRRFGQGVRSLGSRVRGMFAGGRGRAAAELESGASPVAMAATGAGEAAPSIPSGMFANAARGATPNVPARVPDRINIGDLPPLPPGYRPLDDPRIGRVAPLGEQPTPTEMADVARAIRPEDVTPVNNTIEGLEEAVRANPGTIRDVPPIKPRDYLDMRTVPTGRPGQTARHRGPLDAEAYLRSSGGIRDQGGELRHMGLDNRPRDGMPGDRVLGPLVRPEGMTLDEAGEALWGAGYFRERPTIDEVLDVIGNGRRGNPLYRSDDLDEVDRYRMALDEQMRADRAASEGGALGFRVGDEIGPDDLDAMQPPATAYEDLPRVNGRIGNINLANLETSEDIRRAMQNVEQQFGGFDAARRGTISHAETQALANDLGMTVDELLKRRRGQALNAEQTTAARMMLGAAYDDLTRLAARAVGPDASDVTRGEFARAAMMTARVHEEVSAAVAETGRALSAMRIPAASRAFQGELLRAITDNAGGKSRLEDMAGRILELQRAGSTPEGIAKFAREAIQPRNRDKLVELYINGLLSGIKTHVVNNASNLATHMLQIPEYAAASALGQVRRGFNALRGREDDLDRVLGSELGARTVGLMQGSMEGIPAFARALRTGDAEDFVTKIESRSYRAISGVKGEIARLPSRFLVAEDEFFKAIGRRMHINGEAVRQARREGLTGQAARDRIADLSRNPTQQMMEGARDYARYLTFQKELGPVGRRVSQTAQEHPWLRLVLPFVRTPTNLLKFATERSPLGFVLKEVRNDLRAGGARRDLALVRMALGTGMGALAMKWASDGTITGGGPADEGARQLMMADGWQPYSVKIGDTYYSYARFDPLSTTLGIAADMVDRQGRMTESQERRAGALFVASIMRQLGNKTWLSGASELIGAFDDPDRNLTGFLARIGGSAAVPTIAAHAAQAIDPVMRDTRVPTFSTEGYVPDYLRGTIDPILGRIQSRIPGQSSGMPARLDVLGNPIQSEEGGFGTMVNPFPVRTARGDPIAAEALRLGVNISRPSRRAAGGEYTGWEYQRYQELAGRYMRDDLMQEFGSPEWQAMSDEDRERRMRSIIQRARRDARADINTPGADGWGNTPTSLPPLPNGYVPLPPGYQPDDQ